MKLKKEEKEEKNLARLIQNDLDEMRDINHLKRVSGVTLLSNRFQTKLPVSERMQMQIQATL
jgi:DeoR/GlpR family transcriptional regulator of sugar metabolism